MKFSPWRKYGGRLACAVCFCIYLATLCPTVHWGDSGELIAAAYTLGVPHPPGHPLYSILGKLFTLLPVGSVAYRVNLMSAFFGALTCLMIYKIITERLDEHAWNPAAAFGGALFFACAPTVWDQSTVAETSTLHSFFMMTLSLFAFRLASGKIIWKNERRSLLLFSFLYGLSLTNHVAGVFFFPAFAYIFLLAFGKRIFAPRLFFSMLFWFCAGLVVYAYLPIRSMANPPIDWGNPENLHNFLWVITARQYAPKLVTKPTLLSIAANILLRGKDLLNEFSIVGCALGLVGARRLVRAEARVVIFSLLVIAVLFYVGLNSAFISAYFIPAIALMAVWIGVGLQHVFKQVIAFSSRIKAEVLSRPVRQGICVALAAGFMLPFGLHFREMDRSRDVYALRYGEELLGRLPDNSALFTVDGYALFILWYLKYCENKRPDLMVIEPTWILADSPLNSQVLEQYPNLVLPKSEMVNDYEAHGVGHEAQKYLHIQAVLDANYGQRPIYWGIVSRDVPFLRHLVPDGIIYRYTQSKVVLDPATLLRNTEFWDKEISYFQRNPRMKKDNISREIYPVDLNNQGVMFEELGRDDLSRWAIELALKFNPEYPISRYNLARLEGRAGHNTDAVREYKHAIAGNPYMATAYYGLGNTYRTIGDYAQAFVAYRRAARLYPKYHEAITAMGQLYLLVGQNDDAVEQFKKALKINPTYVFAMRGLAYAYVQMNKLDDARQVLDKALQIEPDSAPALYTLAKCCARAGDPTRAARALKRSIEIGGDEYLTDARADADLKTLSESLSTIPDITNKP